MARILLVDDDADFAAELRDHLQRLGHEVCLLDSAEEALHQLAEQRFDVVLLDNLMPRMSGLEFLEASAGRRNDVPVILMTNAHDDQTVFRAINLGAADYAIKPLDVTDSLGDLGESLRKILEINRRPLPVPLPPADAGPVEESVIVGRSRPMVELLVRIAKIAPVSQTVLILGETGTGKDLVARALHTNSPRKNKPFVVMNCTALNDQLLESELFGHERGAFTGADKLRKGRFEHAHGGTLFLDEVGDMPPTMQFKLLRVLENREIVRVGSNDSIRVDVRIVAATHRDLKALVREGKFREDLFHRLEGMTLHIPPLRDRPGDVEWLARTFLARMFGSPQLAPTLHPETLERLRSYRWPGNVRQLQKVLSRAVGTCRWAQILPEDLDFGEFESEGPPPPAVAGDLADALRRVVAAAWEASPENVWPRLEEEVLRELLRFALAQPGISQVQLAKRLGVSRNYLRGRIKHFGFEEPASDE